MGDKFDGALAGGGRSNESVGISEALQTLSLNETLIAADEDGNVILLRAVQNPSYGGIMMVAEEALTDSNAMTDAIKLSQMTSMLTDESRCSKYAKAIEGALQARPNSRVLDIGCGTGLLAMLAARAGARHVDAVEMFEPMAKLAAQLIIDNKLDKSILVQATKSTSLGVNDVGKPDTGHTLTERADILVTEIFDSALLGEACLPVISHARQSLLHKDSIVIPHGATSHGVLVSSSFFSGFHDLGKDFPLHRGETCRSCRGGSVGIPLHIDALQEGTDFRFVSKKFSLFDFSFTSTDGLRLEDVAHFQVPRIAEGIPHGVLTWWELELTENGDVAYSTEPGAENWQDHWLPVLYPLPTDVTASAKEDYIRLSAGYDQLSFWFAYGGVDKSAPACCCGFHVLPGGPYRISELGDKARLDSLTRKIRATLMRYVLSAPLDERGTRCIRCIDVSDSTVCGLLASRVSDNIPISITSVEEDSEISAFLYGQVARAQGDEENKNIHIEYNPLSTIVERELAAKRCEEWHGFDVILSEPYTRSMQGYPLSTLGNLIVQRRGLTEVLSPTFTMVPQTARIKAKAIQFASGTLQKAFGPVHAVQGLSHTRFAELYRDWPGHERISLPLFQYKTTAVSADIVLHTIDLRSFGNEESSLKSWSRMRLTGPTHPEAVVLWVEYDDEAPVRTARSEVIWLGKQERAAMGRAEKMDVTCTFHLETGSFTVELAPPPRP